MFAHPRVQCDTHPCGPSAREDTPTKPNKVKHPRSQFVWFIHLWCADLDHVVVVRRAREGGRPADECPVARGREPRVRVVAVLYLLPRPVRDDRGGARRRGGHGGGGGGG